MILQQKILSPNLTETGRITADKELQLLPSSHIREATPLRQNNQLNQKKDVN